MIRFNFFPEGKQNCITFSYDDGNTQDKWVAQTLRDYDMKGTFHLINRGLALLSAEEVRQIYSNHEIACHGEVHASLDTVARTSVIAEVMNNRRLLEEKAGYPVIGMSYANGRFSDSAIKTLQDCGIVYSRTVYNTGNFNMPQNFMQWNPTCHHNECISKGEQLLSLIDGYFSGPRLLYIWGHAHEFDRDKNFYILEDFCKMTAHHDKIWFATNLEIYSYCKACRELIISADERIIKNPTLTDVWLDRNGETVCVKAGQTMFFE